MAEATCHSVEFLTYFSDVLGVLSCCCQSRDYISEAVHICEISWTLLSKLVSVKGPLLKYPIRTTYKGSLQLR